MKYYVYILISQKRSCWSYVGSTGDLNERFYRHRIGGVKSTKGMLPLQLIYVEEYDSKTSAYNREVYLKSGFGREEKTRIIKNYSGIV